MSPSQTQDDLTGKRKRSGGARWSAKDAVKSRWSTEFDCHPGFQQIALVDRGADELSERRLLHREEAEQFYRKLQERLKVRVGMESSGHSRWFERLLRDLQFELWIGNAAQIRTKDPAVNKPSR